MATLPFTMTEELRTKLIEKAPVWNADYPQPGEPKLFLLTDPEFRSKWVVLYGWFVSVNYVKGYYPSDLDRRVFDTLQGDVVYRGPAGFERVPQISRIVQNVYLLGCFKERDYKEI